MSKQVKLCEARVAHLLQDSDRAVVMLKQLQADLKDAGDEDITALVLMADIQDEVSRPFMSCITAAHNGYRHCRSEKPKSTQLVQLAHRAKQLLSICQMQRVTSCLHVVLPA